MGLINFHNHSEYSFLSSLLRVDELVGFSAFHRFEGCALTDTLSTFGYFSLAKYCERENLKPVFGIEIFVKGVDGRGHYPIILIALDNAGLENIFSLNTLAQKHYYREKAYTLEFETLAEYSKGLAVLVEKELYAHINSPASMERIIECYEEAFPGSFYIEVNYTGEIKVPILKEIVNRIENYSMRGIASCESRYFLEDRFAFDFLNDYRKKSLDNEKGQNIPVDWNYSVRKEEDFYRIFKNHPLYIENAQNLFSRIDANLEIKSFKLPVLFDSSFSRLKELCRKKLLNLKTGDSLALYEKRLEYELGVIQNLGLSDYFLLTFDIARFMRLKKIPYGFGRGSSVASLILFLLGVTKVDPVENRLIFERFLNPGRKQMPDIDLDVCWKKRKFVFSYIASKYGEKNIAHLSNINRFMARSVIREIAKSYRLNKAKLAKILSSIPMYRAVSIEKFFRSDPKLNILYAEDPEIKEFLDIVMKIEGQASHSSLHAGGIIVVPDGIRKYASLEYSNKGELAAQLTKDDLENTGFIKMDILGLRFTTIIDETMRLAGIKEIDFNNQEAFQLLGSSDTIGVFQLESPGMRGLLKNIKPLSIRSLSDVIALYRPGPMKSGMMEQYIKRHNSPADRAISKEAAEITKETYGLFIYQEQILRLAVEVAGMDWGEADSLRKALSSKSNSLILSLKNRFLEGCIKNNVDEEYAQRLFGILVDFGAYSFNQAHSLAYAYTAYTGAYLKANFPLEFYLSSLNNNIGFVSRLNRYIMDMRYHSLGILPISINHSKTLFFRQSENALRAGFALVKYVGANLAKKIVKEREQNGEYQNLLDFYFRMKDKGLHNKAAECLIKAGAFDDLCFSRRALLSALPEIAKFVSKHYKEEENALFSMREQSPDFTHFIHPEENAPQEDKMILEFEATDIFLSHHPLDQVKEKLIDHNSDKIEEIGQIKQGIFIGYFYRMRVIKTKNGSLMAFGQLSDDTGTAEVVFFPKVYQQFASLLKGGKILLIRGKTQEGKIIVEQAFLF
jgi:DNA polymerase-3 subunit alpha